MPPGCSYAGPLDARILRGDDPNFLGIEIPPDPALASTPGTCPAVALVVTDAVVESLTVDGQAVWVPPESILDKLDPESIGYEPAP